MFRSEIREKHHRGKIQLSYSLEIIKKQTILTTRQCPQVLIIRCKCLRLIVNKFSNNEFTTKRQILSSYHRRQCLDDKIPKDHTLKSTTFILEFVSRLKSRTQALDHYNNKQILDTRLQITMIIRRSSRPDFRSQ